MSMKGLMRTALWTEIRGALKADFRDLNVPHEAPRALAQVIISNADYMSELVEKNAEPKEQSK